MKTLPTARSRKSAESARKPIQRRLSIHRIVVPIDFSAPSLDALDFAVPWAKQFGSELHLVHVFEPDYSMASIQAMEYVISELEVGRRIRREMKQVAQKHSIELSSKQMHYLKGRPFEEICNLARKGQVDLIVIATRRNTGLKHLVLGSTAERIVRFSPCPVLVVRRADSKKKSARRNGSAQTVSFKKIVVPMDFSECSMKGLAYAKALAKQFGARLILLNSVNLHYYITNDEYARYDYALLLRQSENASRKQMRDLIRTTDWEGIKVEASMQIGHAGDQICSSAKDHNADLIVTSTHGRTGLKHVLIGSTAEYVVRHANCPVLVVPSHERPAIK